MLMGVWGWPLGWLCSAGVFGLPCLASFPFRSCCKEGEPKCYLLLALQSLVGRCCFHLRGGQCSFHAGPGIWQGEMPLLHHWDLSVWLQPRLCACNKTAIVLCRLLKLLRAFQLSPCTPPLSEGRQVAEGILLSPKITQACPAPVVLVMRSWLRLPSTSWCLEAFKNC